MNTLGKTLTAGAAALALLVPAALPADAATSKHCGIKTSWRLAGSDEDGTTRIKVWWKASGTKELAFAVESWDLRKTQYDLLSMASTDQAALGSWWAKDSVCKLVRVPNTIQSFYAEAGVTRTGLVPGRDDDVCGVALAYGQIGQDSRGLVTDDNFFNAAGAVVPDYEMVIECEYQWNVRPGFVIQPGMQYIVHPGGSSAIENAFVLSLRTVFDF